MGEDRAADVAPREGLQPGQFLGQDTPHPTRITLQDPFFFLPRMVAGSFTCQSFFAHGFYLPKNFLLHGSKVLQVGGDDLFDSVQFTPNEREQGDSLVQGGAMVIQGSSARQKIYQMYRLYHL